MESFGIPGDSDLWLAVKRDRSELEMSCTELARLEDWRKGGQ